MIRIRPLMLSLLGLVLAGLLASGCASSQEQGPAGAATPGIPATAPTSAPAATAAPRATAAATVAPGATAAATSQVQGARATPEGTVTSTDGQGLLQEMEQFQGKLRQLAGDNPQQAGLTQMTEQATQLMQRLNQGFTGLDPRVKDRALGLMSDTSRLMGNVVETYAKQHPSEGGQPGLSPPPNYMAPTREPTAVAPLGARQTTNAIEQLRTEMRQMASGTPSGSDISVMFGRMGLIFQTMQAQLDTVLESDVQVMVQGMTAAMDEMDKVMQVYVQQQPPATPVMTTPSGG